MAALRAPRAFETKFRPPPREPQDQEADIAVLAIDPYFQGYGNPLFSVYLMSVNLIARRSAQGLQDLQKRFALIPTPCERRRVRTGLGLSSSSAIIPIRPERRLLSGFPHVGGISAYLENLRPSGSLWTRER